MRIISFLVLSVFSFSLNTSAQTFKAIYDPSYKTETGSGFYSDFEFAVTGGTSQNKATTIVLTGVKVNLAMGWYQKTYSGKAKFYSCAQLRGLCEKTELGGFWIHIVWEYAGKTYENGGQFTGKQTGDKFSYISVKNYFTPPSEIPPSAWASVSVKEISISSCSYTTSNEIFTIVSGIK